MVKENIRKPLSGEAKTINYQFKGKKRDGSLIDVEVLGAVTPLKGKPAIIGTIMDITEQVRREKEKESLMGFLQSVLNSIQDHIMVIRPDYRVELMNASLGEIAKKGDFCYTISHGRETPCKGIEHPCPLKEILDKKRPVRVVHKHIKPDGSEMVVEIMADKEKSLITLAVGIAHDFNNKLMGVLGYAELLKIKAGDECIPYIEKIISSSEKMAILVRQMLTYTGQGTYQPSDIDLNESIVDALNMTYKGSYKNIKVDLDLEKDLWPVFADKAQIEQMMINLLLIYDLGGFILINAIPDIPTMIRIRPATI